MKSVHSCFGLLALLVLPPTILHSVAAAAVLDQYFEPDVNPDSPAPMIVEYAYVCSDFCQAQTFTVGTSGELSRVELFLGAIGTPSGNLILDIVPTTGGAPTGDPTNTLARAVVPVDDLLPSDSSDHWVGFDISSFHLGVTPNEPLAIVLRGEFINTDYGDPHGPTPLNNYVLWRGGGGSAAGQAACFSMNSADRSWSIIEGFISVPDGPDRFRLEPVGPLCYGFRTYVEPVPEPSSAYLIGGAAIGFAAMAGRRLRSRCSPI